VCKDNQAAGIPDVPSAWSLSENVTELKKYLHDLVATATRDPIESVAIREVRSNGTDEGCVVCLIPPGKNPPYQAAFADKRYYIRSGERMAEPTHDLLRYLFKPRINPNLQVHVSVSVEPNEPLKSTLMVWIENAGNGTAKDVFVSHRLSHRMIMRTCDGGLWRLRAGNPDQLVFKSIECFAVNSIHPNLICPLVTWRWEPSAETLLEMKDSPIRLEFDVYTENAESKLLEVAIYSKPLVPKVYIATNRPVSEA
jgi:hypothetical protein